MWPYDIFLFAVEFCENILGSIHTSYLKTNYSICAEKFLTCVFWLALIIFISCRKCRELTNISKKNCSRVLYLKVSFYIHMAFSFFFVFFSSFIHVTIVSWHALFTYLYFFAGSNLLLQRIMVKRGVPEDMTFVAFDSTTSLCTSSYVRICITLSFCIVVFLFREKKFSILLYSLTENAWQVREENWFATSSCGRTESYDSFSWGVAYHLGIVLLVDRVSFSVTFFFVLIRGIA